MKPAKTQTNKLKVAKNCTKYVLQTISNQFAEICTFCPCCTTASNLAVLLQRLSWSWEPVRLQAQIQNHKKKTLHHAYTTLYDCCTATKKHCTTAEKTLDGNNRKLCTTGITCYSLYDSMKVKTHLYYTSIVRSSAARKKQ